MKKSLPILISTVSVIAAIGGMAFGMKASNQQKAAEQEARSLREQLAAQNDQILPAETNATPLIAFQDSSGDTNELAYLKAVLAERDAELDRLRAPQPPRESFEERMAKLKQEDPAGYAERIQRRQERQQTMRYNLAERTVTFMDLDTTHMTTAERENHELLVEKMAHVWSLTEPLQDPEQPPDREAMRELYNEIREVRPLINQERTVMFKQLGTDLGYEGNDAQDFADHVEDIISATSLQMPRSGRRGRP